MKKEWTVKLGLLALILTLVTTSLVSGTFAKYTSQVSGTDTARVAKFEFDVKEGDTELEDNTVLDIFGLTDETAVDQNGEKLVAPGTKGDFELYVENKSEVDVKAVFELNETNNSNIPIYYTLEENPQRYSNVLTGAYDDNGTPDYEEDDAIYKDLDALKALLKIDRLDYVDKVPDAKTTYEKTIKWFWAYEDGRDASDTTLGLNGTATVTLAITCTVTQLDD